MYTIYLKHLVHGTKVAISDMEAAYDEENGWVRYNPEEADDEPGQEDAQVNHLVRRGRPRKNRNV